jgi:hypothetical protein
VITPPAIAHQIQIDSDVGGTAHIEPNDAPRAGEPTLAWFALTRRGGINIPLADCDCQLTLYTLPEETAIATPELSPLSVEGYEDIPSATITFPSTGRYELVLQGAPLPTATSDFQAFELRFPVTVATVAPAAPAPTPEPESAEETAAVPETAPTDPAPVPQTRGATVWGGAIALGLLLSAGAIGFAWAQRRQ